MTARTREDLPKGFPDEIPGVPYFCDGYKHPQLEASASLDHHIAKAMEPYLANLSSEEIPEPPLPDPSFHPDEDHLHF